MSLFQKLCSSEVVHWVISVITEMNIFAFLVSADLMTLSADLTAILMEGMKNARPNLYMSSLVNFKIY